MRCSKCGSERIIESMGKASDCQVHSIGVVEHSGGLKVLGVLDEDYLRFKLCLECGQMQGRFPALRIPELEPEFDDDKLTSDDILIV